ncbi:LytTR family DNA-binding domain-containing protein [Aquimarina sp. I32.4]|uniref:LytTR family DNA-binding domain-containing protein n=1 Tax=Aquimarina sp. I32.4 TaxID=2053903 RepID=UPI000CDE675E|nr:LytTR family DNA-binding domain-containing protein [Aquimarina sp. I32.4]
MIKLNPSIKHHLLIGVFICIWGFIFAFFIRPFDDGTLNFKAWILISIGFNVIAFIAYALTSLVQKFAYQKIEKWNITLEVTSIVFYQILYTIGTFIYYKSPFILSGGYTFWEFFTNIIFKTALIVIPIVILARRYSIKLIPIQEDILSIKGDNKLDILKIKKSELISISNAQNYVEIFFVNNSELNSKLIRSSLTKMQEDLDFLVQIHRSHLINPSHFKSWKNKNTISLTLMELPVSKKYKEAIQAI